MWLTPKQLKCFPLQDAFFDRCNLYSKATYTPENTVSVIWCSFILRLSIEIFFFNCSKKIYINIPTFCSPDVWTSRGELASWTRGIRAQVALQMKLNRFTLGCFPFETRTPSMQQVLVHVIHLYTSICIQVFCQLMLGQQCMLSWSVSWNCIKAAAISSPAMPRYTEKKHNQGETVMQIGVLPGTKNWSV